MQLLSQPPLEGKHRVAGLYWARCLSIRPHRPRSVAILKNRRYFQVSSNILFQQLQCILWMLHGSTKLDRVDTGLSFHKPFICELMMTSSCWEEIWIPEIRPFVPNIFDIVNVSMLRTVLISSPIVQSKKKAENHLVNPSKQSPTQSSGLTYPLQGFSWYFSAV